MPGPGYADLVLRASVRRSEFAYATDLLAIVIFTTIGLLNHHGAVSVGGYARDVLTIGAGWTVAFLVCHGRFLPTWLAGATLGVAIRTVALSHYHWDILAFWLVTLVFLGAVAGGFRLLLARRRLAAF